LVTNKLKFLFVGRPQKRKKLELALKLAKRRKDVIIRLVGPGMDDYFKDMGIPENVEFYPAAHGSELIEHFQWSNLVINPGHAGLLVMNAATHNRPLIIDSVSEHAPEIQLARESDQFFVDFENQEALDSLLGNLINNPFVYEKKGSQIHKIAKNKYTVENMTEKHMYLFQKGLKESKSI